MTATEINSRPNQQVRDANFRKPRPNGRRLRLGGLATLLFVSAALFVAVVCWHRDLVHVKRATEVADAAREWIGDYYSNRDHLPFALPFQLTQELGKQEVPYPARDDIYTLTGQPGPYLLVAGERQGLLPPREAGCAAIFFDHGKLHTEWLNMDEVELARKQRDELLGHQSAPAPASQD